MSIKYDEKRDKYKIQLSAPGKKAANGKYLTFTIEKGSTEEEAKQARDMAIQYLHKDNLDRRNLLIRIWSRLYGAGKTPPLKTLNGKQFRNKKSASKPTKFEKEILDKVRENILDSLDLIIDEIAVKVLNEAKKLLIHEMVGKVK